MPPTIDPTLQYCPQCGDEYRTEIQTCASCALLLISGQDLLRQRELLPQGGDAAAPIGADEPVVTIQKGPMLQIKALQALLHDQGMSALMVTESGGACGCRGAEALLQVRVSALEPARAALAREYRQSTGLTEHDTRFAGEVYNPDADEAVCPACGFRFATSHTCCPDCGLCFA